MVSLAAAVGLLATPLAAGTAAAAPLHGFPSTVAIASTHTGYVEVTDAGNVFNHHTLQDAVSRLSWAWDDERRHHWALDQARAARRLTDLRAERGRLVATIPPDVTAELADARAELNLHEATSGAPDDTAPHLLTRIARLEDEATARRAPPSQPAGPAADPGDRPPRRRAAPDGRSAERCPAPRRRNNSLRRRCP